MVIVSFAEERARVEAKHGDPSRPGYTLLHPRRRDGTRRDPVWSFDVDFAADKDTLKEGQVVAGTHRVNVEAATQVDARLAAEQMVAARGKEPTGARLVSTTARRVATDQGTPAVAVQSPLKGQGSEPVRAPSYEPDLSGIPKTLKERLGRCYELAGRFITNNVGILVHGSIQGFDNPRIGHAWVELPDGNIWEPASAKIWPVEIFSAMFNPEVEQRYDEDETRIAMLRSRHWGPWVEPLHPLSNPWVAEVPEEKHGDPSRPGYRALHPNSREHLGEALPHADHRSRWARWNARIVGDLAKAPSFINPSTRRFDARKAREWRDRLTESYDGDLANWFEQLQESIDVFQTTSSADYRYAMEHVLRGGEVDEHDPGDYLHAETLIQAIHHAPPIAPEVYRGTFRSGSPEAIVEAYPPGRSFQMSPASFSADKDIAENFAGGQRKTQDKNKTGVIFRLHKGAQAFPVQPLTTESSFYDEAEWVTGGQFHVTGTRVVEIRNGHRVVIVDIEQEGTFGLSEEQKSLINEATVPFVEHTAEAKLAQQGEWFVKHGNKGEPGYYLLHPKQLELRFPSGRSRGRSAAAVEWAKELHKGQTRKGSNKPYVSHVLQVGQLVKDDGGNEAEYIAAVLHDAVEDTPATLEQVRARFGNPVAKMVETVSELERPKPAWKQRKITYIAQLSDPKAPLGALRVSAADKLANATDTLNEVREVGPSAWEKFDSSPEEQLWFYRTVSDTIADRLHTPLATELRRVVTELEVATYDPKERWHRTPGGRNYRALHVGKNGMVYYLTFDNENGSYDAFTERYAPRYGSTKNLVGRLLTWRWNKGQPKEISRIAVDDPHRRQGIASALLALARQDDPDLRHSSPIALTEDGAAWAAAVKALDPVEQKLADQAEWFEKHGDPSRPNYRLLHPNSVTPAGLAKRTLRRGRYGGGFTFNIHTKLSPRKGYAVSPYPQWERKWTKAEFAEQGEQIIAEYIKDHIDQLSGPGRYLGGWWDAPAGEDEGSDNVYLDVVEVLADEQEAFDLAHEAGQDGIMNLTTRKYIEVGARASREDTNEQKDAHDHRPQGSDPRRNLGGHGGHPRDSRDARAASQEHHNQAQTGLEARLVSQGEWFEKHGTPGDPGYQLLHPNTKIPDRPGKPKKRIAKLIAEGAAPEEPHETTRRQGMRFASDEDRKRMVERNIVIPPAWTYVQIAESANDPLQAVGYDEAAREQRLYSTKWTTQQAAIKWDRIKKLSKHLGDLDKALQRDYRDPAAGIVVMIRRMGLRPGSEDDTRGAVQAYGASTLKAGDVTLRKGPEDDVVELHFVGKHGVDIVLSTSDPLVVRTLRAHKRGKKPNEPLFAASDAAAARYFKKQVGDEFKIKDLRTHFASAFALAMVKKMDVPKTKKAFKDARRDVAKATSALLGNTPKVALDRYISPTTFGKWERALRKLEKEQASG